MKKNLSNLFEAANENEALANELNAVSEASQELAIQKVIAIADKYGFELTESDFVPEEELSLDELEQVAGGEKLDCVGSGVAVVGGKIIWVSGYTGNVHPR